MNLIVWSRLLATNSPLPHSAANHNQPEHTHLLIVAAAAAATTCKGSEREAKNNALLRKKEKTCAKRATDEAYDHPHDSRQPTCTKNAGGLENCKKESLNEPTIQLQEQR